MKTEEKIKEYMNKIGKIGQMEKNLELLRDWKYLNEKDRELNSFEKGIKEECERLLNDEI